MIGITGVIVSLALFVMRPSFPTPDKLLVLLTFIFMAVGQTGAMLKRFGPFVALLLVYEMFRGAVPGLNARVNFTFMPAFDEWLFGSLPTPGLQAWLWQGTVSWYDMALYLPYMLHFVMPLGLAVLVWKYRPQQYWRYAATFVLVSFAGFITYLLFPAAPPWMASDLGYIQPIERVSSHVWAALGVQDFPSLYNRIAPNPVAAVPSLHTAYAVLFTMFIYGFFGKKWGSVSAVYPLLIMFGTVYQGEHYVIDIILGIIYAAAGYYIVQLIFNKFQPRVWSRPAPAAKTLRSSALHHR